MNESKKKLNIKKIIINGIILSLVLALFYLLYRDFSHRFPAFNNPDEMRELILSFGNFSLFAFIFFQILQVVVFFIPGEVMQIAGGYIFGPVVGSIVSTIGILLGSVLAYYAAKAIGRKRINALIERKNLTKIKRILDAGSNKIVILIIYFIPGIPKDLLVYVAGVSNVSLRDFIMYSTLGRAPWIIVSAIFGHGINNRDYVSLIVIGFISCVIFLFGILKGHSIIDFYHTRIRHKERKDSKTKGIKR